MSTVSRLVSVVIPTWNRAEFIESTIKSVLEQTYSELELLICDDGSTDATEEIVRSTDDSRVRWLPGPRAGRPAPPRNRGIRASAGAKVAFLDSDDRWVPEKLEVQLRTMEALELPAVCSNAHRLVGGEKTGESFIYWNRPRITFKDLLIGNIMVNSSVMLERELLAKVTGYPETADLAAVEDHALWMRVASLTDIAFCEDHLVYYRDDPIQSIREHQLPIFESRRKVAQDFENWALEVGLNLHYRKLCARWYVHGLSNAPAIAVNAFKKIRRILAES